MFVRHMKRLARWQQLVAALFVVSLITTACASGSTLPAAGTYSVQKDSVQFDGERYQLYYADASGAVKHLETKNLKMVRDESRTYLEVPSSGDPVLHMREDEPIHVQGQDQNGAFSSPWFPFLLGAMLGNSMGGGFGTPTYRYPPTGTFGRDEQLRGSIESQRPQLPDYSKVQPAPNATTGQASGTGGGNAASNKAPTTSNAATNKGGFANGSQSFASRQPPSSNVGAGSNGGLKGGGPNVGKPSSGVSGGKGVGGARAPVRRR
jgi:hypothetical protein